MISSLKPATPTTTIHQTHVHWHVKPQPKLCAIFNPNFRWPICVSAGSYMAAASCMLYTTANSICAGTSLPPGDLGSLSQPTDPSAHVLHLSSSSTDGLVTTGRGGCCAASTPDHTSRADTSGVLTGAAAGHQGKMHKTRSATCHDMTVTDGYGNCRMRIGISRLLLLLLPLLLSHCCCGCTPACQKTPVVAAVAAAAVLPLP